jgi:DNA-binding transcriptional regulator YiaG
MTASEKRRSSKTLKKESASPNKKPKFRHSELSPVLKQLVEWMEINNLSQRQAAEVLSKHDFPVSKFTIQSWQQRRTAPEHWASKALEAFLEQHPKITDAPAYGRWKSPNKDVAEIHKLRKTGMTLLSIAQRFGISESAVSRICAGNRRAKEN